MIKETFHPPHYVCSRTVFGSVEHLADFAGELRRLVGEAGPDRGLPLSRIILRGDDQSYEAASAEELRDSSPDLDLDTIKSGTIRIGWPGNRPVSAFLHLRRKDNGHPGHLEVDVGVRGTNGVVVDGLMARTTSLLNARADRLAAATAAANAGPSGRGRGVLTRFLASRWTFTLITGFITTVGGGLLVLLLSH